MSGTIRILGIDPALANTGFALAEYNIGTGDLQVRQVDIGKTEKGSDGKQVRKSSDDLRRARVHVLKLRQMISEHKPHLIAAEVPMGAQDARAAFSNGICCGFLASLDLPLIEVSPNEVKLAAVSDRNATKSKMIEWAVGRWPNAGWKTRKLKGEIVLLNENEHMADACGTVCAGILTAQFSQAVAMMQAVRTMAA